MAVEVIDLLSSSPIVPNKQGSVPPLAKPLPTAYPAANRSKRVASPHGDLDLDSHSASPLFLDLRNVDEIAVPKTRGSKRRKFSERPPQSSVASSRSSIEPPPPPRPNQTPLRTDDVIPESSRDIIELVSSSPFDTDDPGWQNQTSERASSSHGEPRQSSKAVASNAIDSDPFPSSPMVLRFSRQEDGVLKKDDVSLVGAPSRPQTKVASKFVHIDSSDPFATSPILRAAGNHESASRNDWDPISSSAPTQLGQSCSTPSPHGDLVELGSDEDNVRKFDKYFPLSGLSSLSPSSQDNECAPKQTKASGAPKKSADQKRREREAKAISKAFEREKKKQEKEKVKAAKRLEKERAAALAEVNKVRTDRKVSTPEMIVMIPSNIDDGLKAQVGALLDELNVQWSDWECPSGTTFKWRRKVQSRFDEELGRWEPMPLQIKPENHALTILTAQEVIELTLNGRLDSSIQRTKNHFPGHMEVYIIQGMNSWIRQNRNIRNRQFASVVRQGADAAESQTRRRNAAANEEHVCEDVVEDALLRLQIEHQVLIHHTETQLDTAQWVVRFTQHISTIPYKKQRDEATSSAGFCMESGQVRTGEDAQDTYVRLLQEIARVTAPIAHGIAAEFKSVSKLVNGLERGGPTTLEGLRRSANKDGGFSDRMIGQAVSKRIHKVFTGRDEGSTDV